MQNMFPRFNIESASERIGSFHVGLHDHKRITDSLYRVVLSYTGNPPRDPSLLHSHISKMLAGNGAAVVGSFSPLTRDGEIKAMIGFVHSNREVIPFSDAIKANADGRFKAMASNLLMDQEDESLWEIRSGASGKFLAKQQHADLSELVHLATASVASLPKFAQLASIPAARREFACFVDKESEEIHHGFVVSASEDSVQVVDFETRQVSNVDYDQMVEINELSPEEAKINGMEMAPEIAADQSDANTLIEYYKKAYSHSPEYVQKIIQMISQHRFG